MKLSPGLEADLLTDIVRLMCVEIDNESQGCRDHKRCSFCQAVDFIRDMDGNDTPDLEHKPGCTGMRFLEAHTMDGKD